MELGKQRDGLWLESVIAERWVVGISLGDQLHDRRSFTPEPE